MQLTVGVIVGVPLQLHVPLSVLDAVRVTEAVNEGVRVGLLVCDALTDTVLDGVRDAVLVTVAELVRDTVAVRVALGLGVPVRVTVAVAVEEVMAVEVPVVVEDMVVVGVADTLGVAVLDPVVVGLPVAVEVQEGVQVADGVPVAVGLGVGVLAALPSILTSRYASFCIALCSSTVARIHTQGWWVTQDQNALHWQRKNKEWNGTPWYCLRCSCDAVGFGGPGTECTREWHLSPLEINQPNEPGQMKRPMPGTKIVRSEGAGSTKKYISIKRPASLNHKTPQVSCSAVFVCFRSATQGRGWGSASQFAGCADMGHLA